VARAEGLAVRQTVTGRELAGSRHSAIICWRRFAHADQATPDQASASRAGKLRDGLHGLVGLIGQHRA
jgi:hypothetical protein